MVKTERIVGVFESNQNPTKEMLKTSELTKKQIKELYKTIESFLPSKERSICLTQLEAIAMTANKAIFHYISREV